MIIKTHHRRNEFQNYIQKICDVINYEKKKYVLGQAFLFKQFSHIEISVHIKK